MKQVYLLCAFACAALFSNAQIVTINGNVNTTQLNGTGSAQFHVSEYLYTEAEIGASNFTTPATSIKRINLNVSTLGNPTTINGLKIYLRDVPSTTTALTAGTYSTAGYTEVYAGSLVANTVGWVGVNLTTPFVRTSGSNLQMMIERTDGVSPVAPTTWWCLNGTNLSRRYNGATALQVGTTALALSAFRISAQFVNATDLSVLRIETLGKIPTVAAFPHQIKAVVQNSGSANIPAGTQVSLAISGANTFTNVKTTSALAPGAQQTITFDAVNAMVAGTNTITVSVPTDDVPANNTATFTQTVTNTTFGYPDGSDRSSSIGFNTGQGLLVAAHTTPQTIRITGIRAFVTTAANTIFGVICDANGAIIAQTPDYNVVPSDSLTYKTINFTTPVTVNANTNFLMGIGQRTGTYGYFPLGTQAENPARPNIFASITPVTGGAPVFTTALGRFMLEADIEQVTLPVTFTTFSGKKEASKNILTWATANELNNKGFEVLRSANGSNFSSIGFVASKNGNATATTNYTFADEKPLSGTNFYRLKQIDQDGKSSLSTVVVIRSSAPKLEIATIYPNPTINVISAVLNNDKEESVTVVITDMKGNVLKSQAYSTVAGSTNVTLNVASLSAGTYFLKVNSGDDQAIQTVKFIKQ